MALDFSRKPAGFNTATRSREYDRLCRMLLIKAEQVCHHLLPEGKRINGEWRVGSIQGERGKSMGVNLKDGVWKDFDAGEGGSDLLSLWAVKRGVKMHEAYDEAAGWLGIETPKTDRPSWAPVTVPSTPPAEDPPKDEDEFWWRKTTATKKWEYFDGAGELWVTVCRFERAGEKVIRPWDHKRMDWRWPEGMRPLFGLAEIRKAPDPIVLVEGEKCADRLNEMGFTATTMPGGANAAKTIDWTPLRGRHVIRWGDNDYPREDGKPTGRQKWDETTREHLEAVGVRSIRDVTFDPQSRADGWDCADATDAQIVALLETARTSAPVFEGKGPFSVTDWDVASLYAGAAPDLKWLVKDVLPLGKGGLLAAQGDAGKSMLLLDLALKVATPRGRGMDMNPPTAFGQEIVERGKAVLFMAEDDTGEVHRRLVTMDPDGSRRRACAGRLFIVAFPDAGGPPKLVMGDDRSVGATAEFEAIRQQLRAIDDLKLIGFDPTTPFVGGDLNKPHVAGAVATMIAQLAAETGATVICTHHMTKGERSKPITTAEEARHAIRGAAAYVDGLRFALAFWPVLEEGFSYKLLAGLGRDPKEKNAVYRGAVVKANFKTDRSVVVYVRDTGNGLLSPLSADAVRDAANKPLPASDQAMTFLYGLVTWCLNQNRKAVFGSAANPFAYVLDPSKAKAGFVPITEKEWKSIANGMGIEREPSRSDVGRAAKIIVADGPQPLCPLRWTADGFDVAGLQ